MRIHWASLSAGLLMLSVGAGCSQAADVAHCKDVLYVSVASSGTVTVNGAPVAGSHLNETLAQIPAKYVLYYREGGENDPPPAQATKIKEVLTAIMRLQRPISMSSKPDFSDSIDGNGMRQPRTTCPEQG